MNVADMAKVLNHLRRDTVVKVIFLSFLDKHETVDLSSFSALESVLLHMLDETSWQAHYS